MSSQQAEQEIRRQETRRFEAMVKGDIATLEAVLSDDLTYTHASGVFETKPQFLAHMKSGKIKYESFTPEQMLVRVYDTTGVVTGQARVDVHVQNKDMSFRLRFTDVYTKQNNRWLMVAWQATRLP